MGELSVLKPWQPLTIQNVTVTLLAPVDETQRGMLNLNLTHKSLLKVQ